MATSSEPQLSRTRERLMPQNLEAEQATLGSMLIDRDAVARVSELLLPEDFYREAHRLLYHVALHLFDKSQEIDLVTVTEELRRREQLDSVGGPAYLTTLVDAVPAASNVARYAEIVQEKSLLRNLIFASDQIAGWAYEAAEPVMEIVDKAEQQIFGVAQRNRTQDFTPIKPLLAEAFERIDKQYKERGEAVGIPTDFADLDELTSGLNKSELVIIAGRPSMGKTAFVLNIARNVAVKAREGVGLFSLEMSKEALVQRLICSEAQINAMDLRRGYLQEDDWLKIGAAIETLYDAPLFIDDTPAITTFEIRAKARRLKAEHDVGLIVVDYLQLVRATGRAENRQVEVSMIAQSLKSLARELNIPVIACSQLSRALESREDKRPMLSDLRESGAIEQDADVVMFIYRESRYRKGDDDDSLDSGAPRADEPDPTEIIVAKQRNGPTGKAKLLFFGPHTRFESWQQEDSVAPGY